MSVLGLRFEWGFRGTAKTIEIMRGFAWDAIHRVEIARLAGEIVQSVPRRDYAAEAAALLRWMQQNIRYTRDPWVPQGPGIACSHCGRAAFPPGGIERVQHPLVTLFERRAGDCDCLSTAYAAMCGAIGLPWAFRTVGIDPSRPLEFQHVYALVWLTGNGWVPADPSFEEPIGWEPPGLLPGETPRADRVAVKRDWM